MTPPTQSKLSPEQEQALADLTALLPDRRPSLLADLLKTWLGISHEDATGWIQKLLSGKASLQTQFVDWTRRNPLDAALEFLVSASVAFYAAEKDVNPKIRTYVDAFYYIATCASVGYADIFAVTQAGRSIAALVMIVGPALAARTLDRPSSPHP
jgi:hypothetical protein